MFYHAGNDITTFRNVNLTQSVMTERKYQHVTDRLSSSVIISELSINCLSIQQEGVRTGRHQGKNISNTITTHFNISRFLLLHFFITSIEIKMVFKTFSMEKRHSNAIQKINGILHDNGSREILVNACNKYKNCVLEKYACNQYRQQFLA